MSGTADNSSFGARTAFVRANKGKKSRTKLFALLAIVGLATVSFTSWFVQRSTPKPSNESTFKGETALQWFHKLPHHIDFQGGDNDREAAFRALGPNVIDVCIDHLRRHRSRSLPEHFTFAYLRIPFQITRHFRQPKFLDRAVEIRDETIAAFWTLEQVAKQRPDLRNEILKQSDAINAFIGSPLFGGYATNLLARLENPD